MRVLEQKNHSRPKTTGSCAMNERSVERELEPYRFEIGPHNKALSITFPSLRLKYLITGVREKAFVRIGLPAI